MKITKLLTRENFGPTKYTQKKFGTHKIPTRKYLNLTKYTREKNFRPTKYPRRQDGTMALDPRDPRWHATHEI